MENLTTYKMRAECQLDVGRALEYVHATALEMTQTQLAPGVFYPDVDVTFTSSMTLAEIKQALRKVPDGHVMRESVNLAADYTGEREELDR